MDSEILAAVEQIRKDIFDSYISKGLVASGEFGRELTVESDANSVKILSAGHVEFMEGGRRAGTRPPVSVIKKWIKDKNQTAGTNIPEEAAFAIALVIGRDGITVPNRYNPGKVVSEVLNEERVRRLVTDVDTIISVKILTILTQ